MKKDTEVTFIIYPVHKNGMQASGIAVSIKDSKAAYSQALAEAKLRSRLSDFPEWSFY
jgi:hypothetical protein